MEKNIGGDLKAIMPAARNLAFACKHGFIHFTHLFVAMLQQKCAASPYLSGFNADLWAEKVKLLYEAKSNATNNDSLPLTLAAERCIKHACHIATLNRQGDASTVDLLIAILSFDNEITTAFNRAGVLIEDITLACYKKAVKKYPLASPLLHQDKFNSINTFFLSDEVRKQKLHKLLRDAWALYHYHEIEICIQACKTGLGYSPLNVDFREVLAYAYMRRRDFKQALEIVSGLAKEKTGDRNWMVNLSYVYDEIGNYTAAEEILKNIIDERPNDDLALNNRGFNLLRQKRYAEAVPFFEMATQVNPEFAYPWNNLGFAIFKLGEVDRAMSLIDKSLELDRGNSFAYKNKALIFLQLGNKEDALRNLTLALKYDYTEKYGDEVLQLLKHARN